jgi:hypothetical protein
MVGMGLEQAVERAAGLPILGPSGPASERTQVQPDVVQVQLAEKELGLEVGGIGRQACVRQGSPCRDVLGEGGDQVSAGLAGLDRLVFVLRLTNEPLDLEEQGGRPDLVGGEIARVGVPHGGRLCGRGLVAAVVVERLGLVEGSQRGGGRRRSRQNGRPWAGGARQHLTGLAGEGVLGQQERGTAQHQRRHEHGRRHHASAMCFGEGCGPKSAAGLRERRPPVYRIGLPSGRRWSVATNGDGFAPERRDDNLKLRLCGAARICSPADPPRAA